MKKISFIHEAFIEKSRRPMSFGKLPVSQVSPELPVIPMNKWLRENGKLCKKFLFRTTTARNLFLGHLFEYETDVNHHASLRIDEDYVEVRVFTKNLDSITEIDKEYARSADNIYKDVVYSTSHDTEE